MNQQTKNGPAPDLAAKRKKRAMARLIRNLVLLAVVIGGAAWGVYAFQGKAEAPPELGATFSVAHGDLRISVLEDGNLKAQKSVKIECEVEGQSTIVWLVPEGTYVKEGDTLVELDSKDLEEDLTQRKISYENARADKIQAEEAYGIQLKQNESDIKAGELNLEFAQKEYDKFMEKDGQRALDVKALDNAIFLAEEELKRAEETLNWSKQLFDKEFITKDEYEADRLSFEKRKLDLDQKRDEKRLAELYDLPMQERKLKSDWEEAERELVRIKARAASQKAQKEADLKSREAQFDLQEERYEKTQEQLEKVNIKAPQPGLVVYGGGGDDHRRGGGSDQPIEEGATVRYRQDLITLPDVSVMVVDAKVHESSVDKVAVDQRALVTVDAYPDKIYEAIVSKVAILPDSQSRWLNPDLKEYTTEVTMKDTNGKLKPGMSAKVEIIVTELKDVIYVPIQAVYRRGLKEVCYVVDDIGNITVRPVQVGMNNEQFVVIHDGLEKGEKVLLYVPAIGEDLDGDDEEIPDGSSPEGDGATDGDGVTPNGDRRTPDGDGRVPVGGKGMNRSGREGGPGSGGSVGAGTEGRGPGMTDRRGGSGDSGAREGRRTGSGMGDRSRGGIPGMDPAVMQELRKLRDMTPEEREKAVEKLKAEGKIPESFGRGFGGRRRNDSGQRDSGERGSRNGGSRDGNTRDGNTRDGNSRDGNSRMESSAAALARTGTVAASDRDVK